MDPSGALLRVVRDATGALVELMLAPNGTLSRLRLLQLGGVAGGCVGADTSSSAVRGAVALTTWLIGQTVDSLGGMVQRVVDVTRKIVERSVDATGRALRQRDVGNVLKLAPVSETRGADWRIIRVVRDSVGTLLEVTLNRAGQLELVRSLVGAPPATR